VTEDLCAGTLTHVFSGTVLFDDFRLGRTFVLTAGQSRLARAPQRQAARCARRRR
jgi:hypothetical protein